MNKHIFDLEAIKKLIKSADEQVDYDGNTIKRVYLGTVYSLMPSGKYYQPFACENVDVCSCCKGNGYIENRQYSKLTRKRMLKRGKDLSYLLKLPLKKRRTLSSRVMLTCSHCGGLGSREAYLDAKWVNIVEKEIRSIGAELVFDMDEVFIESFVEEIEEE